jgi:hypothetical protein
MDKIPIGTLGYEDDVLSETANNEQKIDEATIHLSGTDGETVYRATQIVIHKMPDGKLFIELYPCLDLQKLMHQFQFDLSDAARRKLIAFLEFPKTY